MGDADDASIAALADRVVVVVEVGVVVGVVVGVEVVVVVEVGVEVVIIFKELP